MKPGSNHKDHVTTALLLAAGTGSRLFPLTQYAPKCLTMVNGKSILERMVFNLNQNGFKRLVIVTGHLENHIRDFLGNQIYGISIEYIFSPLYRTTNNIYSLWMARNIIKEPFLLLESDLVFDKSLLADMLHPGKIAVAKMQPWMNGTNVTFNRSRQVKKFLTVNTESTDETKYKTVNIYSISLVSWNKIVRRLDRCILKGKVNDYYETIFAEMISDGSLAFTGVSFDNKPWYEIDTIEDLRKAEILFPASSHSGRKAVTYAKTTKSNIPIINTITSSYTGTGILNATK